MFKSKYPRLQELQTALSHTGFLNRLSEDSQSRKELLAAGPLHWRNVYLIEKRSKVRKILVRLFLNGEQVRFSKRTEDQFTSSCRLADLALLFFWKYRLRGGDLPPLDAFNFSRAQAQEDLRHESVIRTLLEDFEAELVAIGTLPTAEQLDALKRAPASSPVPSLKKQAASLIQSFGQLMEAQRATDARLVNIDIILNKIALILAQKLK